MLASSVTHPSGRASTSPRRVATSLVLLVLLVVLGWRLYSRGLGVRLGAAPAALKTDYKTEEEWVVGEVVRDVVEMGCFAARREWKGCGESLRTKELGPGRYGVTAALGSSPIDETITVKPHLWAPEAYSPFASTILRSLALSGKGTTGESPGNLAADLLDLRAAVLERENKRVSERLARGMLDASAHDEAAVLLGAFGLREAAAGFSDLRAPLARLTAHLSMARASRTAGGSSSNEHLAEAVLLTLVGRGADAKKAVDSLETAEARTGQAWRRALGWRLNQDVRVRPDPAASLLERIEYFRAVFDAVDHTRALEGLGGKPEPITDWSRIAAQHPGAVSLRALIDSAVPFELVEARTVGVSLSDAPDGGLGGGRAFLLPSDRCLTLDGPHVLGRGLWAAFLQRHLMAHAFAADQFYRQALASPETADAYQAAMDRLLLKAPLFPLMDTWRTRQAEVKVRWLPEAIDLAIRRPELITAFNWEHLGAYAAYEPLRVGMPRSQSWFRPALPRGTTFDFVNRKAQARPWLAEALALAPQDFTLQSEQISVVHRDNATLADLQQVFGDRAEYDLRVLRRIAGAAPPRSPEKVSAWSRLCEREAADCFDFGWVLADRGDEEAAAAAYERGIKDAADEVTVANNAGWLVRYHHRRGRRKEAEALAARAAATGAAEGLRTQAWLLEAQSAFGAAEGVYEAVKDRYPPTPNVDGDPVLPFLFRMSRVRGDQKYGQRFEAALLESFPRGLEMAALSAFHGRPEDGVWIGTDSRRLAELRLSPGDIIVAVDGWRVHNTAQYDTVRDFTEAPEMSLIVFHQGGYVTVKALFADRRLGVGMRNHPLKGWSDKGRQ